MRLFLLRHPPVAVEAGYCYGREDVPLVSDWGRWTEAASRYLAAQPFELTGVWSSPASRCLNVARAIDSHARVDGRLSEFDFGDWEGRNWGGLPAAELEAWNQDLEGFQVPGGESLAEVSARVWQFFAQHWDEAAQRPGEAALWVSHGGTLRAFLCGILGMPLAHVFKLQFDHGALSVVSLGPGGGRLLSLNQVLVE